MPSEDLVWERALKARDNTIGHCVFIRFEQDGIEGCRTNDPGSSQSNRHEFFLVMFRVTSRIVRSPPPLAAAINQHPSGLKKDIIRAH